MTDICVWRGGRAPVLHHVGSELTVSMLLCDMCKISQLAKWIIGAVKFHHY
jgi:hypothetical protein